LYSSRGGAKGWVYINFVGGATRSIVELSTLKQWWTDAEYVRILWSDAEYATGNWSDAEYATGNWSEGRGA
jgi:hypothetical protein